MMKFDLEKFLDLDLDSFYIRKFIFKPHTNVVDYAVIEIHESDYTIWYDVDDCIQLKECDECKGYVLLYDLNTNEITLKTSHYDEYGIITRRECVAFSHDDYTEETFFMISTLHDVGEFTFETFDKFNKILKKIKSMIKEIENEQSK